MDRSQKAESVAQLNATFSEVGLVVITRNLGMSVAQSTALRGKIREVGATYKVAKNRLAKLALDGTDAAGIKDLFVGPTMVAYAADPVSAPKVASAFAKGNDKFVLLGGALGKTVMDANAVKALADLPSLDELRGKLIGLIQAPATKIAGVLQAPAGQLARVFNAYATKDQAAG